jgi:hypothetical protein
MDVFAVCLSIPVGGFAALVCGLVFWGSVGFLLALF